MQLIDGQPVFSATDLVGYLACEHLTALERAALTGLVKRPNRPDPELDVIRRRGIQHEERYLAQLRAEGRSVATIERHDDEARGERIRRQADETVAAMARGVDVVYQATFFDGRWLGYADFLLKVEDPATPSVWGPWHYEVADTKLARHVKAGAVLQMCSYVEQLERIQGVLPQTMYVALGGSAHETVPLRVNDYLAYYRASKARFEESVLGTDAPAPTYPPAGSYPEPVEHCDVCRWAEICSARRRADDHLSLVAGISARQRKAFVERQIDTVAKLGAAPLPFEPPLEGLNPDSVARVREQARIQVEGSGRLWPIHELFLPAPGEPIEPERGLAALPEPSEGDLFFDIEGDPYAFDDGVEYLFGVLDTAGAFTAFWAFDPEQPSEVTLAGEKVAFEAFIDFVMARLATHPDLHVYHYAQYEPTALKRLMGRHATREEEVDQLLRGGVLVDLFRTVHQSLRASVESYSIKKVERLYGFERKIDLRDAGSSIVAFEEWLELAEGERPTSDILQRIEDYNRDDVVSTRQLRDWLEEQRRELARLTGQEVPRPGPLSMEAPAELKEADARVAVVAERLTAGLPLDARERTDLQQATWLLAQLLAWHRREAKSSFWEFFYRMDLEPDALVADKGALGGLELIGPIGEPTRKTSRSKLIQLWRYRFPPQEHDIGARSVLYDPALRQERPGADWKEWKVEAKLVAIDEAAGTLDLSWLAGATPRHPAAIVPLDYFSTTDHRASLLRLGSWVADHGVDADGAFRAGRDLLLRRAPDCGQGVGEALRADGESELEAARRLATALRRGTLAIQGPPGSGKTYAGARMILDLLAAGKTVGITANSHKVIVNFLQMVCSAADAEGGDVRAVQKVSEDEQGSSAGRVLVTTGNDELRDGLRSGRFNLGAGTSWLWASAKSDDLVDVLFVDEAGQMSLANVLAMAGAARSLVLLGDPQQLDQPLQGSHPPGADRSALAHFLGDAVTMPEDRGLFLEHTWRLHPAITAFTSTAFYDGRLRSREHLSVQALQADGPMGGVGLRLLPADHAGNDNEADEEARQVADVVRNLVESGSAWIDQAGSERPLRYEDVLVVAPYNAQVGAIQRALPSARVGTVDKFQGQEAPVSVYSMTSSSPEDAPRGMGFLYSRHRLNVATSRARCVAVVVATPALLRVRARTPEQMRLANALCQFAELAR